MLLRDAGEASWGYRHTLKKMNFISFSSTWLKSCQQVRYLSWNEARRNNKGAICLSDPEMSIQKAWAHKEETAQMLVSDNLFGKCERCQSPITPSLHPAQKEKSICNLAVKAAKLKLLNSFQLILGQMSICYVTEVAHSDEPTDNLYPTFLLALQIISVPFRSLFWLYILQTYHLSG